MSVDQVGQGAYAIVPTFQGFRKAVAAETDAAAKQSDSGFRKAFSKTGENSGKETGAGFKKAFASQASGFSDRATKELERAVASSAAKVSAARLKEQDAAGKVRVAEAQLAEARQKYTAESSQVIRAQERLSTAARQLDAAQDVAKSSTNDLREAQSRLASAADRAGDELAQSGRKGAGKYSSGFTEVFKGSFLGSAIGNLASELTSQIGYAIGAGLRAGIQFGLGTIDIASDLNESLNAVQVAYGADLAPAILALGETSAKTFGLARRDLNSYAVQFSAFSKTIAGDGGDVVGTFTSILGRATDFASVMNLEVSDALLLFQSGLAGETEPLRRYGIDLSAAAVEAYALSSGLSDGSSELTEQQKQMARYGSLLAQTAAVQGDFANTSGELANQNRINAATWDDLQAKIGQAFLPVASDLASLLADDVFPVIEQMVNQYGPGLSEAFADSVPALTDLAKATVEALPDLIDLGTEALPLIIKAGEALIPILRFLTEDSAGFFTVLQGTLDFLSGNTTLGQLDQDLRGVGGTFGWIIKPVGDAMDGIIGFVTQLPTRIVAAFVGARSLLVSSGRALIQGFIDGMNQMFKPVSDAVSGIISWVQGFFPNSPAKRGPLSGPGWTNLQKSGGAVMEQWTSGFARPDLTGRISAGLVAPAAFATASSSSSGGMPRSVRLVVGGREFDAYLEEVADGRVVASEDAQDTRFAAGRRRGA